MNGKPTREQSRWHSWLVDRGCILTGGQPQIHHIGGSKMKLKGVGLVGEWFVIPVCPYWHKWDSNKAAIHSNKKQFERENKTTEKELFIKVVSEYEQENGNKPMSEIEYQTIIDRG